jgi:hypothetical protein
MDVGRWIWLPQLPQLPFCRLFTVYCLLNTPRGSFPFPFPLLSDVKPASLPRASGFGSLQARPRANRFPWFDSVTVTWPFSAAGATCCPLAGLWCRPSFRGGLSHSTRHRQPYQAIVFRLPQALLYSEKDRYLKSKESKRKEKTVPVKFELTVFQ